MENCLTYAQRRMVTSRAPDRARKGYFYSHLLPRPGNLLSPSLCLWTTHGYLFTLAGLISTQGSLQSYFWPKLGFFPNKGGRRGLSKSQVFIKICQSHKKWHKKRKNNRKKLSGPTQASMWSKQVRKSFSFIFSLKILCYTISPPQPDVTLDCFGCFAGYFLLCIKKRRINGGTVFTFLGSFFRFPVRDFELYQ